MYWEFQLRGGKTPKNKGLAWSAVDIKDLTAGVRPPRVVLFRDPRRGQGAGGLPEPPG